MKREFRVRVHVARQATSSASIPKPYVTQREPVGHTGLEVPPWPLKVIVDRPPTKATSSYRKTEVGHGRFEASYDWWSGDNLACRCDRRPEPRDRS